MTMLRSVTKVFSPDKGYSCCFRNWRAESHCRLFHGYDLRFELEVFAEARDIRGWIVDFGAFGPIKQALDETFDHKMIVADDDPHKDEICALAGFGVADVVVLPSVGCEAFAEWFAVEAAQFLMAYTKIEGNIRYANIHSIKTTVWENGANRGSFAKGFKI